VRSQTLWKRVLKILHLLGAAGMTGAIAVHLFLLTLLPADSLEAHVALRRGIDVVAGWVLVPSLAVAFVSGLLAISVHPPFTQQGWVWVKAGLGLPMFQATLVHVASSSRRAAELAAEAAVGEVDAAQLAGLAAHEWDALWLLLALSVAQTAIGVWRPRRWIPRRLAARLGTSPAAQPASARRG